MKVYLDNAATSRMAEEVLEAMKPYLEQKYGNANSLHELGREAREAIEKARETIAKKLNAAPHSIIFTSGATEANNFAIKGVALANKEKGKHIITQKTEHPCVLESCKWLEKLGYEVTYLNVNNYGQISLEELESAIRKDTILVSIMHANNETGTLQPIYEIAEICKDKGIYFHTDASQTFTKEKIDFSKLGNCLITLNSHKIHGPKGVGALVIHENVKIEPLLHGGGQEFGLRSGTENTAGIVGFAKAVEIAKEEHVGYILNLRKKFEQRVMEEIPKTKLNGHPEQRVCHICNFSFKGIEGDALVMRLDMHGIACSTGSACSTHKKEPSHVLKAMGLSDELANASIRFSFSRYNKEEEIDYVIKILKEEVDNIRKIFNIM